MKRQKIIIRTSIYGIIVNLLLVVFKGIVGLIVNSIAIILDAINNLTDAISSIVTIIGTFLANKKPDKKHPYGYGRIEYFTSVIVGSLVLVAGITAMKESISKIINPTASSYSITSLIIVFVAVIVKFGFGRYVKNVGKKINSDALVASGQDAFMDSILSFTTLLGALASYIAHINIEGYLGLVIAIFIIKTALEILKETIDSMIGVRVDKELTQSIKKDVNKFDEVIGSYDLTLHNYGPSNLIGTIHIEVRDDLTASSIHALSKSIVDTIYNKYNIFLTIGIYASNNTFEFRNIKKDLVTIIKEYKNVKQMHGFFVDKKSNNIYFDLIFDFDEKDPSRIKDEIIRKMKEKHSQYNYNVILDNDYSD